MDTLVAISWIFSLFSFHNLDKYKLFKQKLIIEAKKMIKFTFKKYGVNQVNWMNVLNVLNSDFPGNVCI